MKDSNTFHKTEGMNCASQYMLYGMSFGLSAGLVLSGCIHSIMLPLGMVLGMSLGMGTGALIGAVRDRKHRTEARDEQPSGNDL